jgi:PAT family beta-lactamase induction signal transducer AmpG
MESTDKSGFYFGFSVAYLIAALVLLGCAVYNTFMVPKIPQDQPVKQEGNLFLAVVPIIKEYFQQRRVVLIILLILLYRFGEGFLAMKGPFYLDPVADGGLASEATDMPLYGILTDMPWMIVGGILGGYAIKWWGLKRTFIPLAAFMSLPNVFYVWLAMTQPSSQVVLFGETLNLHLLYASSIESLGYGMSFSAMFYYMHIMATECGKNKTSILAISFALMNVGWIVPSMMSGFVQSKVGYTGVFIVSSTVGLTALLIIPFLPMPKVEQKQTGGGVAPIPHPDIDDLEAE